jgi:hypothetical protein
MKHFVKPKDFLSMFFKSIPKPLSQTVSTVLSLIIWIENEFWQFVGENYILGIAQKILNNAF